MSRVSKNLVADAGATTLVDITITYTTDDPGTVPDGAVTIADGDSATATGANFSAFADEVEYAINQIHTVLRNAGIAL